MADKTNIYKQIAALRRETATNAITPNLLGSLLKGIVDLIGGTVDNSQLDVDSDIDPPSGASPAFAGGVVEDTYTPLLVSEQRVEITPGGSRTLNVNRTAQDIVIGQYDSGVIAVAVSDETISIVASGNCGESPERAGAYDSYAGACNSEAGGGV